MATVSITNHVCKGARNVNDNAMMTWWQTSFNMPVPYLFGWTWSEWWPFQYYWESTSFDLTWFQPGWEICANFSLVHIVWPSAGGPIVLHQWWTRPDWTVIYKQDFPIDLPPLVSWQWYEYIWWSNQWFAEWEINASGNYTCQVWVDWVEYGRNDVGITFSNVPSISTADPWYMWVEYDNLHWVSANWHKHTIYWNSVSVVWSQYNGSIWVEWNDVCWVWNWTKYRSKYNFKQFQSTWWWSTTAVWWKTPWYFWMDNEFWFEHIWYIAWDTWKYLFPSWANPYANPPASSTP